MTHKRVWICSLPLESQVSFASETLESYCSNFVCYTAYPCTLLEYVNIEVISEGIKSVLDAWQTPV